jgi:20S proteasome subunit alpha 3
LFAGYDEHYGFQLYQSDPSGNYSGWKATVIGANNQAGKSLLKNEYGGKKSDNNDGDKDEKMKGAEEEEKKKEEDEDDAVISLPDVKEALRLAVKVLNKTMDASATSPDKMELFCMTLDEDGECSHQILSDEEAQKVIDEVQAENAPSGDS